MFCHAPEGLFVDARANSFARSISQNALVPGALSKGRHGVVLSAIKAQFAARTHALVHVHVHVLQ